MEIRLEKSTEFLSRSTLLRNAYAQMLLARLVDTVAEEAYQKGQLPPFRGLTEVSSPEGTSFGGDGMSTLGHRQVFAQLICKPQLKRFGGNLK